LSGLGGDELFAGYNVFKQLNYLHKFRSIASIPVNLRSFHAKLLNLRKPSPPLVKLKELLMLKNWDLTNTYPLTRKILPDYKIQQLILNTGLPANKVEAMVKGQTSFQKRTHFLSMISCAEICSYMQNTLLRDTDQMSMAHALEVRVPFLDYELVAYVLQVSDTMKYPHKPKQLLVESMENLLPKNFSFRPKMGFTLPWEQWMHNELKSFCEDQIRLLSKYDFMNSYGLMNLWNRFLNYDPLINWSRIWVLVALAHWLESNHISQD
jgi:asparagine synthase (glutamine-hydrolysing)